MKMDEFIPEDFRYEETDTRKKERMRSDLISKRLGELLLQGFKMLNSTCEKCECILMQKKNEPVYCVGCQDKDVLALNGEESPEPMIREEVLRPLPMQQQSQREYNQNRSVLNGVVPKSNSNQETIDVIRSKITWATEQLRTSNVISYNIELLEMIKKASEAITELKRSEQ